MAIKMNKQIEALLAAAEARKRGEKAPSAPPPPSLPTHLTSRNSHVVPIDFTPKRILGLDIALRKTGWGIVDVAKGQISVVDCGAIINQPKLPVSECLRNLFRSVATLVEKYHPDAASIEGGFFCQNQRTAIVLGTARGATIGVLADAGMAIYEYAPRRVKQAVCGFGNASKGQVARLVAQMLKIDADNLSDDTTDALALAICHGQLMMTAGGLGLPDPI